MIIVDITASPYFADPTGVASASPAFSLLRTNMTGLSGIRVTLGPSGSTFMFDTADISQPWSFPRKMRQVIFAGDNTTFIGNGGIAPVFKYGVDGPAATYVKVDTVLAGASTVHVKTGDITQFTANTWCMMMGFDLQGGGTPQNPHWFEYVYVTNVNSGTGVITFQNSLRYTYKDTWPQYGGGENGGPATLFNLDPDWDCECEYQNITFSQPNAITGPGCALRKLTFTNCSDSEGYGFFPGNNLLFKTVGCDLSLSTTEVDKMCTEIVLDSTIWKRLNFQSSSNDLLTLQNGSTITEVINGTPKRLVMSADSTTPALGLGAHSYGASSSVELQGPNCVTSSLTITSTIIKGAGDVGINNDPDFSMTDGVIRAVKGVNIWNALIPGIWCMWMGLDQNERLFQVTDVYEDGTYIYFATTWSGGFPSVPVTNPANALWIRAHPAPSFTWIGSDYRDGYPLYSDSGPRTITKALGAGTQYLPPAWGALESVTFDITTKYTGVQPDLFFHLAQNNNWPVLNAANAEVNYGPIIDVTVGPRTVVVTPAGITGNVGTDTFTGNGAFPAGGWFTGSPNSGASFSRDVSGESAGPSITVTIKTDQGIFSAITVQGKTRLRWRVI